MLKARDRQHDRLVALKVRPVADEVVGDDLLVEARILPAVPPHPALPLVREDFFDRDSYVDAMDWVDGTDLATRVRDQGRPGLAPSSVLAYLAQAAEALTKGGPGQARGMARHPAQPRLPPGLPGVRRIRRAAPSPPLPGSW